MSRKLRLRNNSLYIIASNIKLIVFDFDGVFTDNRVIVLQNGEEGVFCSRSDGIGLKAVRELGIYILVISAEVNSVVNTRCRKLNLECVCGCNNKLETLLKRTDKLKIPLKNVAYLGNDTNDLECLVKVGLPACVSDAHPSVLKNCLYVTKLDGGKGAVREFCDFIVKAKYGTKH